MPRAKRRRPYNPAKAHDRRSRDLLRDAEVATVEVDDPLALEPGEKIVALRSMPRRSARSPALPPAEIDEAQICGGASHFSGFGEADVARLRAVDPDPGDMSMAARAAKPITEGQRKAVLRLKPGQTRALAPNGSALVHDVLVQGLTMEQIGQRRGPVYPKRWSDYFFQAIPRMPRPAGAVVGRFATEHPVPPVKTLPR